MVRSDERQRVLSVPGAIELTWPNGVFSRIQDDSANRWTLLCKQGVVGSSPIASTAGSTDPPNVRRQVTATVRW